MGLIGFIFSRMTVHNLGQDHPQPQFESRLKWDEKAGHYRTIKVKVRD